jgi:hypothetical protein
LLTKDWCKNEVEQSYRHTWIFISIAAACGERVAVGGGGERGVGGAAVTSPLVDFITLCAPLAAEHVHLVNVTERLF